MQEARSPNLVRSRGFTHLLLEADRRLASVAALQNIKVNK